MSYKNLINGNVRRAFNLVKDLATDVTLVKKNVTTFDFSTGAPTTATPVNVITKGIIYSNDKMSRDRTTTKQNILLKNEDIGDFSSFDELIVNGVTWKIGPVITSDHYVIMAEIYKEA